MKKLLWLLVAFAIPAYAYDATVSWTNPTKNEDNSTIPATGNLALASTRVEWGSCNGTAFGTKAGEVTFAQPSTTGVIPNLTGAATYCFRAYAKNNAGVESAASNVASKTTPTPAPMPPVLSSTVTVAWDLRNGKPFRIVGRIDLGTPCGNFVTKYQGHRYYRVSNADVRFTRKPSSARVVTRCAIT